MVATHTLKWSSTVCCVTGVYLRNISNTIFFNFAFGCELSEPLLFLSYMLSVCVHATCSQAISSWKVNMGSLTWATNFTHRVHAKVRWTLTSFCKQWLGRTEGVLHPAASRNRTLATGFAVHYVSRPATNSCVKRFSLIFLPLFCLSWQKICCWCESLLC